MGLDVCCHGLEHRAVLGEDEDALVEDGQDIRGNREMGTEGRLKSRKMRIGEAGLALEI